MAFSKGTSNVTLDDITGIVSEFDILHHYFNVSNVPCIISSPLRMDTKPSFGLYTLDGKKVYWKDLARNTSGGLWDLLGEYWELSYSATLEKVYNDLPKISTTYAKGEIIKNQTITHYNEDTDLQCKIRDWKPYDVEFWASFGVPLEWLKYAEIYPISHKIVIKRSIRYVFAAEKYAYAYVERKEGNVTLKIYQPFSTTYKWSNKHDRSVISLWTKVPKTGNQIIICASMKDALCCWANTGIPCIAIQGEGYGISNTAISKLKSRYKEIYILLDNDEAGVFDSEKLAESTGFTNLVLPDYGAKDISDLFKLLKDVNKFKEVILNLINKKETIINNIPF